MADGLFQEHPMEIVVRNQRQRMIDEINALQPDYLLNASIDAVCEYIKDKYRIQVPVLQDNSITVSVEEASRTGYDPQFRRDYRMPGVNHTFYVPFLGDKSLFKCFPSRSDCSTPRAEVKPSELVLTYFRHYIGGAGSEQREAEEVRSTFQCELEQIKSLLKAIESDVSQFNATFLDVARQQMEWRREKFLKDRGVSAALGFPLRKREGATTTYSVPTVRQHLPTRPSASNTPFRPEPELEMQHYEHILSVISSMTEVMERSPKAFQQMKEEDLRQQFLVQLNGHYEGQATGETFNLEGDTDILIRVDGKNIFIAECKFWKGPQSLTKAIDQLLGYTCWRDTKTAIILFNQNKNFSSVLKQIPETVSAHPNCRRSAPQPSETQFRYVFTHRDDPNRELLLTIMAFEVPTVHE